MTDTDIDIDTDTDTDTCTDSDSDSDSDIVNLHTYQKNSSASFSAFCKDPNILYDKMVYHTLTNRDYFEPIIETLFNIRLFEILNRDKCIYCGYFVRKLGHCFFHLDLLNRDYLINNANKIINNLNDTNKMLLKLSLLKKIKQLCVDRVKYNRKYRSEKKDYKKTNMKHHETIQLNKQYVQNNIIMYKELIKSTPDISSLNFDLIQSKSNVKLIDKCQNSFKLVQLRNEYKYVIDYLTVKTLPNVKNDNSDTLLMEIMKNKYIMSFCKIIERERAFKINNHAYRVDIFLRLNTEHNDFIDVIIEVDESHHFTNEESQLSSDHAKDKYFVLNGFSIIRVDLIDDKFTLKVIKSTLNYLTYIIKNYKHIYVFSDKYIRIHNKTINKKSKGIHITRDMLGEI